MSRTKRYFRKAGVAAAAFLMTLAPALDMAVQQKLKPDAVDLGGYLYQLVGRTLASIQTDTLTMAFMFFAALWLANRYLYRKPKATGAGEYLLCGFLSLMMLCCASIRATESVQTLYANYFQLAKVLLYLPGMFLLFLSALRGLNELVTRGRSAALPKLWRRHPYAFPFAVLLLAWLPHIIIKYPGVLMIDSCLQFREYLGLTPRTTAHPPFGTLLYGLMVTFGMKIGSYNAAYFVMTLLQVFSFLAVLSYALWLMQKKGVPRWVSVLSLILFAVSPCYIGWAVVISKDTSYLILCMLAGTLLMDFACDMRAFLKSRLRLALLAVCLYLMILTRHNGVSIAVPVLALMAAALLIKRYGWKPVRTLLVTGVLAVGLAYGTSEAIVLSLNIERVTLNDWLSVPFQQTARVVTLHGDEIPEAEKEGIETMLAYDRLAEVYDPVVADPVKWASNVEGKTDASAYLRVWWKQFLRYPMDYLDAQLNMNYYLFDLQSNSPVYIGLSDNELYYYVYPYSFNDMSFYEAEAIRPLNSWQMALTEWYYRFSDLPVIGLFASMGFCVDVMLMLMYLAWVNRRRRALLVWIPSLVVAVSGLFCPIVYIRYLLPTVCSLPLWLGAYYAVQAPPAPAVLKEKPVGTGGPDA